jgi:uncharacterized membrane protein YgdD (TMEM256/DUF423 family)
MSEEVITSPSDRKKPTEDLSEDGRKAWRLAAILLVCNVLLGAAVAFAAKSRGSGLAWIIALVLAYQLYHLRVGAATAVMILAGLGCVIAPFLFFRENPAIEAWILTAANLGFAGSLFMLLLGEARKPRRIAAVVTFCLLPGAVAALSIIGSLVEAT